LFAQQGVPGVPQARQTLLLQKLFASKHLLAPVVVGQHGKPFLPQPVQVPPMQVVLAAVQVLELQQASPTPPHVPQAPAEQMPPPAPMQLAPGLMQIPETQQPPPLQLLPSQHCMPGNPHIGAVPPSGVVAPPLPGPAPPVPVIPPCAGVVLPPVPAPAPPLPRTPPVETGGGTEASPPPLPPPQA
jgi:hypothetical protein